MTPLSESYHAYGWVLSPNDWFMTHMCRKKRAESCSLCMRPLSESHHTMIESWPRYECDMSHIGMSHVTHLNGSWHPLACYVKNPQYLSHIAQTMSHVTHMNERAQLACYVWSIIWVKEWVMSHTYARQSAACLVCTNHSTSHVTHMNESYSHSNRACHAYEWVKSDNNWAMTHNTIEGEIAGSCWLMSRVCLSHATHECVTSRVWMSYVTRMNEPCHTNCLQIAGSCVVHMRPLHES